MTHGRSGTATIGPSGTANTDDREPESPDSGVTSTASGVPNHANRTPDGVLLTRVQLYWVEGKREHWLRFGKPVDDRIVDRRRRVLSFRPGQVFAFVRWASNDYGTARSQLDIVRCVAMGAPFTTLGNVDPGGDILLSVHGWPKVARVFDLVDAIEAIGIDACDVAPDHWRHVHNRLAIAAQPRSYSLARHRAWLARRDLQP